MLSGITKKQIASDGVVLMNLTLAHSALSLIEWMLGQKPLTRTQNRWISAWRAPQPCN